ncbi:MAG: SAM-dependent methyltransferase [Clostridium tyrobutyricum]|jgi:type I restriction-modification system DNA methylase subunit|uniref:HsdM family class I SAM-dependent methyltransferase n=1 Tax=Clostridium tyrobutyricum TaxID=1519 RepID=UPI001C3806BB|nr:N-6 DNA methylase [Clostridium tyrobutyricum]MBV4440504.1 SAM-dependent methyltransferase [Clostridium tyrobutyricum]MCH4198596.1 SAM-dependent methyltransferase [Clostridium tyrobutyricum]MCH4258869.1 SAM-dependent methyltransferase [Clostridium tyrobutyricum]MCI1239783.1 SAM-dependent methyltransferase [Clostridium tyrobutyricum]MCI1651435.1 SAM-dependent methyltransferase [Clostridium tyrobutyricum]
MSERWTENYTLDRLGLKIGDNKDYIVYAQNSDDEYIRRILKSIGGKPSKLALKEYRSDSKGIAKPEYIIKYKNRNDIIILIECKENVKNHESDDFGSPKKYAVDGVLFYAKYFKKFYNVIAIGVSGNDEENIKVSTYMWNKNAELPENKNITNILSISEYHKIYDGDKLKMEYYLPNLRRVALGLHDDLRALGFTEKEKPLFIAGLLIALSNRDFRVSYDSYISSKALITYIISTINETLKNSDIRREKVDIVSKRFDIISEKEKLKKKNINDKLSIKHFLDLLNNNVYPMMSENHGIDVMGEFYNEFIKYSGGDGKGLGIVLTPKHITELFVELAEVNKESKVLDICCGTGAFLISAMKKMIYLLKDEDDKEYEIKKIKNNLYGVEYQEDVYSLACANMIVRGDGKSHLFNDDCFDVNIEKEIKNKCNVGLINPPYSQKGYPELKFIKRMLDLLKTGSIGIAIVPMSSAIGTKFKDERKDIMSCHRLLAVMSMPDELFYPISANTCIMIWKAHEPHTKEYHKTWFGYWKYDGFEKRKTCGRIDIYKKWNDIKNHWKNSYFDKEIIDGYSAYEYVDYNDEWLVEAYMKTDYSELTKDDFEQTLRNYFSYLIKSGDING